MLLAAIAAAVAILVAQLKLTSPSAPASPGSGTTSGAPAFVKGGVTHVYDGDTVEVMGTGRVRLIGIDSMDGHNLERAFSQARRFGMSVEDVKRWADRATDFARDKLKGRRVTLYFGPERSDGFGRTLAYVHLHGEAAQEEDFNLTMLREGLAVAYRGFPHPRLDEYLKAEKEAQAARAGIWKNATLRP
jgi:micrococcal nuclease